MGYLKNEKRRRRRRRCFLKKDLRVPVWEFKLLCKALKKKIVNHHETFLLVSLEDDTFTFFFHRSLIKKKKAKSAIIKFLKINVRNSSIETKLISFVKEIVKSFVYNKRGRDSSKLIPIIQCYTGLNDI